METVEKKKIRCGYCNKLLGKGSAHDLQIKCPRCGVINHVRDALPGTDSQDGDRSPLANTQSR